MSFHQKTGVQPGRSQFLGIRDEKKVARRARKKLSHDGASEVARVIRTGDRASDEEVEFFIRCGSDQYLRRRPALAPVDLHIFPPQVCKGLLKAGRFFLRALARMEHTQAGGKHPRRAISFG